MYIRTRNFAFLKGVSYFALTFVLSHSVIAHFYSPVQSSSKMSSGLQYTCFHRESIFLLRLYLCVATYQLLLGRTVDMFCDQ